MAGRYQRVLTRQLNSYKNESENLESRNEGQRDDVTVNAGIVAGEREAGPHEKLHVTGNEPGLVG